MPKRIQLRRTKGWRKPCGAIVCTRPGKWGNPFMVGVHEETAAKCVEVFRRYIEGRGHHTLTPERIREELRGRDLCCWCKLDAPCHVDVLLEIANS